MSDQPLTLQEQLVLLCVQPRTGDIAQPHFRYLLSGAALADLLRNKRIGSGIGTGAGAADGTTRRPRH